MVSSRRSVLLTTMGLSGAALGASVAEAPAASAAAYSLPSGTIQNLGSVSGAVTLDLSVGDTFTCTVTGSTQFAFAYSAGAPSPAVTIEPTVIVTQDATGGRQIAFTNVTWLPAGASPVFPTGANQATVVSFLTPDFGTTVYGQATVEMSGGFGAYGDGSDGAIVLDGSTPTPSFLGSGSNYYWALRDIYASSVTIASGYFLQLGGGGTAPYRLYCTGSVTINGGSIVTWPVESSGAKGGVQLTAGSLVPGGNGPNGSGAAAAGAAGVGVIGAPGSGSTLAGGAGGANSSGKAGGAGGAAAAPTGMGGGILPRALPQAGTMSITDGTGATHYFGGGASGGAGAGDGSNAGGAGGAGGYPLFVAAATIVNAGTIEASGGGGGNAAGGNAGGGGGGQGGPIMLITSSYLGSGKISSPGGPGGAGAGSGAAGSAGGPGWIVQLTN